MEHAISAHLLATSTDDSSPTLSEAGRTTRLSKDRPKTHPAVPLLLEVGLAAEQLQSVVASAKGASRQQEDREVWLLQEVQVAQAA